MLQNTQNEEFYILFHSTANCVCGIKITFENVAFCSFHLFTISIQTKEFKFRLQKTGSCDFNMILSGTLYVSGRYRRQWGPALLHSKVYQWWRAFYHDYRNCRVRDSNTTRYRACNTMYTGRGTGCVYICMMII